MSSTPSDPTPPATPTSAPASTPPAGEGSGQPPAATRPGPPPRRAHGRGNWRSLVLSMVVVLAVVTVWLALLPRPSRIDRPAVDVVASAQYVSSQTGLTLFVPQVPAPWRPTSVRQTSEQGLTGWHAGWTHGQDESAYLGTEQAGAKDEQTDQAWIAARTQHGAAGQPVDIAGRQWASYATSGDPVRTSYVATIDGTIVVVTGLTDSEALQQAAASLRPAAELTVGVPTPTGS
ncbi:hypothetical protein BJY21_003574 [Kineosphaera limosa]|uniref:DUF4245 domain-containing protein n=1 Tax=Kineosphaera limosa NBRC 100340 TaxID=1184609 RepID=K6WVE2_9MICO|nr:DUF4245 family protein [Kineosphaera limosa]NYE02390.1 hypothetical protein [Kineosphaera limosa]GAB96082.1 hypothetical protein KILIM_031_00540 [Kineosphaera limosa NBRC 100340]